MENSLSFEGLVLVEMPVDYTFNPSFYKGQILTEVLEYDRRYSMANP